MSEYGSKVGLPPGTVVHTGLKLVESIRIMSIDYSPQKMEKIDTATPAQCVPPSEPEVMRWINVNGVHDVKSIETIASNFGVHPVIIEDISSTEQRPKLEMVDGTLFIVVRSFSYDEDSETIASEQISFILGDNFVLSFQESANPIFEPIIKRLHQQGTRIRITKTDYLTYALVDLLIDNYFVVLEKIGDIIEELENDLIKQPSREMLSRIYQLKRNLILFRRFVWPLREVVFRLSREAPSLINESTQIYLRDLYDHVIRITDLLETYRDSLTGMLDIYLSSVSNRMNEVMRVLTVISTIFIPLTLLASIYGMNFQYMPETQWVWGYPFLLISMVIIGIVLLIYFRGKEWM
ncbi:MAG: magnesium/cobalt transporter CorA [Candidatus Thorarchaeota archaeon]